MRICSGAGCLRAVADDVRFCDECKPQQQHTADGIKSHGVSDRERYSFLYTHRRWHSGTHPKAKRQHPFCCRAGCHELTEIIDHIVPAGEAIRQVQESGRFPYDKWAGFHLLTNLQGLCRKCHALKTAEDKAHVGPWPSVLEAYDKQPPKRFTF